MKISVISFTKTGQKMAERILKSMCSGDETIILYSKCSRKKTVQTAENSGDVTTQTFGVIPNKDSNVPTDNTGNTIAVQESVSVWAGEQMAAHHALVFVGACGIAVRAIAPWITDKLHDSPVLVIDEQGQYVIPLLSGHVGGANELAVRLAGELGAVPVITTATDLHGSFAVDLFAKRNDLWIHNREGIARVSAKILAGEKITIRTDRASGSGRDYSVRDQAVCISSGGKGGCPNSGQHGRNISKRGSRTVVEAEEIYSG